MAYNVNNIISGLLTNQSALMEQCLFFQRELEKQTRKSEALQTELEVYVSRCLCRDSNSVDTSDDEETDDEPPAMRQPPVNDRLPVYYENYEDLTDWEEGSDLIRFVGTPEVRFVIFSTKKISLKY